MASAGIYGARRVHAELTLGLGITVGHGAVEMLMRRAGMQGLPGNRRRRPRPETPRPATWCTGIFDRAGADQLWVTDITEHRTREGKVYCAVVLDAYSRRVVGWSIDATQTAALVTNALDMAIRNRDASRGHDHPFRPRRAIHLLGLHRRAPRASGLLPSMGSIGDCYDNAMIEIFWGRMQTELLDRQRWRTRIELANAIFEYLEIFHNRQRRHSALGMLTPIEYELSTASSSNPCLTQLQHPDSRKLGAHQSPDTPGRFRVTRPLEAGMGQAPARAANAASLRQRPR